MTKVLFIVFALFCANTIYSQSITNKLSTSGHFEVTSDDDSTRFKILNTGEVRWFLDGHDMYIRDSKFEYDPTNDPGVLKKYDFLHIDGGTGRIGFNILADDELPLTSSIHLNGSVAYRVRNLNLSDNYDLLQDDHIVIINNVSGDNNIVLPAVASSNGREYVIKRNDVKTGKITITVQSGEKLNGADNGTVSLNQDNSAVRVACDGVSWWVLTELEAQAVTTIATSTALSNQKIIAVNFSAIDDDVTLTLPSASSYDGKRYEIKRNSDGNTYTGNVLSIVAATNEYIDGIQQPATVDLSDNFSAITLVSNGSRWLIMSQYGN